MPDPVLLLALVAVLTISATLLWEYAVQIALVSMAGAVVLDSLQIFQEGIDIGVNIYIKDILCLVLISAGAVLILRKGIYPGIASWPVFALLSLVAINLARGINEFGLKPAGNEARSLAYLVIPSAAWILIGRAERIDAQRLARWLSIFGCALTILALCRWAGALPMPVPEWEDNSRRVLRVLPADCALVIGQSLLAIVCVQFFDRVKLWRTCLAAVLAGTIVALQHRSVWIATFVGFIWLSGNYLRLGERRWLQLAGSTFIVLTLALIVLSATGVMEEVVSLVRVNLEETQRNNSTWNWRVNGFAEAIDRLLSSDTLEVIVGPPSGRDLRPGASAASIHIHSRYIATFAYYGVIGGSILAIWLCVVAGRLWRWTGTRPEEGTTTRVGVIFLQALFLSLLTYFAAYPGGVVEGSIIALIGVGSSARIGNVVRRPQRDPRLIVIRPQSPQHAHAEHHWNLH
jgi:hypothetical protein